MKAPELTNADVFDQFTWTGILEIFLSLKKGHNRNPEMWAMMLQDVQGALLRKAQAQDAKHQTGLHMQIYNEVIKEPKNANAK